MSSSVDGAIPQLEDRQYAAPYTQENELELISTVALE
jgi:hypothetical protein